MGAVQLDRGLCVCPWLGGLGEGRGLCQRQCDDGDSAVRALYTLGMLRAAVVIVAGFACVLGLSACSSQQRMTDADFAAGGTAAAKLAVVPADFWLTATVAGPARVGPITDVPPALRPARYVMEPDRQLRVAMGSGADEKSFPPPVRRLTAEQVSELWTLTTANGLTRGDHPARPNALPVLRTETPKVTEYVIVIHANGQRRVLMMDAEEESGAGVAEARAIVAKLAGWAWVE